MADTQGSRNTQAAADEKGTAELILRISRYGKSESWTDFTIQADRDMTIVDILEYIRFSMDSTLAFRHSCHHGSCGTCACLINGKERLACMTAVGQLLDEKLDKKNDGKADGKAGESVESTADAALTRGLITVEPLKGFPRVGDLVVDMTSMIENFPRSASYLRDNELAPSRELVFPGFLPLRFENCIECGSCMSACPVAETFIGPAPLAAMNRELKKLGKALQNSGNEEKNRELSQTILQNTPEQSREDRRMKIEQIAFSDTGASACQNHFACSRVCPAGVAPGRHIQELKKAERSKEI
ncbi:MAG: 4Fe-4S dicluster domain-containing protein [Spirochaetia bacterium]|nr:4Fe-4S dicluster domain-containing protein [Spirochaetia bacterium]MCF7952681.1 4Fe-4S dicluster domain-containing protein [Spirochaetales bacterium]